MGFRTSLVQYHEAAKNYGVPDALTKPVPYHVLWLMGIEIPPPLVDSFWRNVLVFGVFSATGLAIVEPLFTTAPFLTDISTAIGCGAAVGVFWPLFLRAAAMAYTMPVWGDDDAWEPEAADESSLSHRLATLKISRETIATWFVAIGLIILFVVVILFINVMNRKYS